MLAPVSSDTAELLATATAPSLPTLARPRLDSREERIGSFFDGRLAQRSAYTSTHKPPSSPSTGAVQAPMVAGTIPTCAVTVSTPSATR